MKVWFHLDICSQNQSLTNIIQNITDLNDSLQNTNDNVTNVLGMLTPIAFSTGNANTIPTSKFCIYAGHSIVNAPTSGGVIIVNFPYVTPEYSYQLCMNINLNSDIYGRKHTGSGYDRWVKVTVS